MRHRIPNRVAGTASLPRLLIPPCLRCKAADEHDCVILHSWKVQGLGLVHTDLGLAWRLKVQGLGLRVQGFRLSKTKLQCTLIHARAFIIRIQIRTAMCSQHQEIQPCAKLGDAKVQAPQLRDESSLSAAYRLTKAPCLTWKAAKSPQLQDSHHIPWDGSQPH